MEWSGQDYAAVIAASASAVVALGAFFMSAWNNRIARSTHKLVNSEMDKFKAVLIEAGLLKEEAAKALGNLEGRAEEKADQALRDQVPVARPAAGVATATTPTIELEGTISGTVETKK